MYVHKGCGYVRTYTPPTAHIPHTHIDIDTHTHPDIGAKSCQGFTRQIDEVLVAATLLRDVCVTRQRRTAHDHAHSVRALPPPLTLIFVVLKYRKNEFYYFDFKLK